MIPNWLNEQFITDCLHCAADAAKAVMHIYLSYGDFGTEIKADNSPVTIADKASHNILLAGLTSIRDIPIISEEAKLPKLEERQQWPFYWLIDPLDGTKEFIKRNGEFAINIALMAGNVPVFGIVYAPVTETCYYAMSETPAYKLIRFSDKQELRCDKPAAPIRVVASRRHGIKALDNFLDRIGEHVTMYRGSAVKICLVAEGTADVYPRFGPTSEWDTAAAHIILRQAGGEIIDLQGRPLTYNQKNSILNPEFLAVGTLDYDWV